LCAFPSNSAPNGEVLALAYEPEFDQLVVGGDFSSFQTPWRHLFLASPSGLVGNHPINSHRPNGRIRAIAFQRDGMLSIGGEFSQLNSRPRANLARILGTAGSAVPDTPDFTSRGGLDTDKIHLAWEEVGNIVGYKLERRPVGGAWGPVPLPDPTTPEVLLRDLPAGTPYFFRISAFNGNGPSESSGFVIDTTLADPPLGLPDPSFNPESGLVRSTCLAVDRRQRIVCTRHTEIHRLLPDGTRDASFLVPVEEGNVKILAVQPDGRILVGGATLKILGRESALVRLLPDGALDSSFAPRHHLRVRKLGSAPR